MMKKNNPGGPEKPLPAEEGARKSGVRQEAKHKRGRANIEALHAASERHLDNQAKYGPMPWGQFYHYVAMELAPHATKAQMGIAIENALRSTEAQETGQRKVRERQL